MKSIQQLEELINGLRIQYVRKYAKECGWDLTGIAQQDLLAIYACLEMKEKFQKTLDKYQ